MTEKQVVPKYVADWIEYCKSNNFLLLWALDPATSLGDDLVSDYKGNLLKTMSWIKSGQDEFARAWVFGYTVGKCPRYKVLIKGMKKDYNYLKHNTQFDNWYMGADMTGARITLWHTKEELEEAGFGWVFSCDGIGITERTQ